MTDRAYKLGFIAKCAEAGVSPYEAGVLYMEKAAFTNVTPDELRGNVSFDVNDPVIRAELDRYNFYGNNVLDPYNAVYNKYYNGLLGKTESGDLDDSASMEFARRMQEIDSGKPGTAVGRWWRGLTMSPEENRRYYMDLAKQRAEQIRNDMLHARSMTTNNGRGLGLETLRPGYKPPEPKAPVATTPAAPAATAQPQPAQQTASSVPPPGYRLARKFDANDTGVNYPGYTPPEGMKLVVTA